MSIQPLHISSKNTSSFCQSSQYSTLILNNQISTFCLASFSYSMITNAWNEKAEAENEMKLQWLEEHGNVRN